MTPEERQLLTSLAERLAAMPPQARDGEAETMIRQLLQRKPEAPYLMAQTILMQDFALRSAQAQIDDLRQQVANSAPPPNAGGSFLGGLFGGGRPAGSVPSVNPWSAAPPVPGYSPVMQPSQTSGFLRSAATTAVGIAGGALLFEGIQSLFSGHQGIAGFDPTGFGGGMPRDNISETVINNYYGDAAPQNADYQPDAGLQGADYDPGDDLSSDDGGGDWV